MLVAGFALLAALFAAVVVPRLPHAVRELSLPLRHEDIIRQQASDKGIDPSLVAAVIYTESRFRDQTSHAGARGLMQITPATARYIARLSGGTAFEQGDLATPQINISYGVYYLRYLLEGRASGQACDVAGGRRRDLHEPACAGVRGLVAKARLRVDHGRDERWVDALVGCLLADDVLVAQR